MEEIKNEIVVYQPNETMRLEVRVSNDTVWLTQNQMACLFGCSVDNIALHLKNIYQDGELEELSTSEDSSVVRKEGKRFVTNRQLHRRAHADAARESRDRGCVHRLYDETEFSKTCAGAR